VPLGQYFPRTAFRSDLIGVQDYPISTPWTVRRAG